MALHVGTADKTSVLRALDGLGLKMKPHFDVLFDGVSRSEDPDAGDGTLASWYRRQDPAR